MKLIISQKLQIACAVLILLVMTISCAHAARNVILMIGDGMSYQHVNAGSYYLSGTAGSLCFEPYHKCGVTTSCLDSTVHPVTDSAAAASAIATGYKVNYLTVSQSPSGTPYQTILELAKVMGKRTGLIGTDPITRATPAAFGAHDPNRNNLIAIGNDYLTSSRPDVMMGGGGTAAGGSTYFSTAQISTAQGLGYQTAYTKDQMNALSNSTSRVLGLFSTNDMTYEHDRPAGTTEPHLSEMTAKALALLDTDIDGFFLMVEGAKIDYGAHANDITRTTKEVVEFHNSVQVVLNWMQGRTDTLLLVTGDHETGGLTAINKGQGVIPGATWTSTDHTAANVPLYAYGANVDIVNSYIQSGVMDNTDVFKVMKKAFAPEIGEVPYLIYDQFGVGTGGSGNIYYGGGVFDGTFYTGQITQCAQQWGDEQINSTALMNMTPEGLQPFTIKNIAKCSFPLGGYIYMGNGGGQIVQTPSWSSTAFREVVIPAGTTCESICTDGTYIYMTNAASGSRHKIYKLSVNHAAGTVTSVAGWPITITDSATPGVYPRFRGISCYNGKLYVVNHLGTNGGADRGIFEINAASGSWTRIANHPCHSTGGQGYPNPGDALSWDNGYQVVRYGDQLFAIALDDMLRIYQLIGTTWTLASTVDLGVGDCYGIGVTGDSTTAKHAWVTHLPGKMSFWDLYPNYTPVTLGDARKEKNGYLSVVSNAVVTKVGTGEYWIEDQDRSAGCRVVGDIAPDAVGKLVSMTGCMNTNTAGEKSFTPNAAPTVGAVADPAIKPVYLNNKNMVSAVDSAGTATDGMLVKITGKVNLFVEDVEGTQVVYVYIDDGSGLATDREGITGVEVVVGGDWSQTTGWEYLSGPARAEVTGIVRLVKATDGTIVRKIEPLTSADAVFSPM